MYLNIWWDVIISMLAPNFRNVFKSVIERLCQLEVVLAICVRLTFAADIVERSGWVRWKAENLNPKAMYGFVLVGHSRGASEQLTTGTNLRTTSSCHDLYF